MSRSSSMAGRKDKEEEETKVKEELFKNKDDLTSIFLDLVYLSFSPTDFKLMLM